MIDPKYAPTVVDTEPRAPIDFASLWRRFSYLAFAALGILLIQLAPEFANTVSPLSNDPANAFQSVQVANRWYEFIRTLGWMSFAYSIAIFLANAIRSGKA